MLSTCWLIGANFLAVSSHKRGRLNSSVYSTSDIDPNVLCGQCCLHKTLKAVNADCGFSYTLARSASFERVGSARLIITLTIDVIIPSTARR